MVWNCRPVFSQPTLPRDPPKSTLFVIVEDCHRRVTSSEGTGGINSFVGTTERSGEGTIRKGVVNNRLYHNNKHNGQRGDILHSKYSSPYIDSVSSDIGGTDLVTNGGSLLGYF